MLGVWCTQREPYSNNHKTCKPWLLPMHHRAFTDLSRRALIFVVMAESTFFQPLTMWRVLQTLCLYPCWFPSAAVMHGAACKGLWKPFDWGMHTHLHIHMPMALYITVLWMAFFVSKGFHLKFLLHVARVQHIPAVSRQQGLPTLLKSR